jgi:hypothetical protein
MLFSKPFSDPGVLRIALFNEFMNSLYLYTIMMLTDFHGYDSVRDHLGSYLVVILGVTVGVNFVRLGWKTLQAVFNHAKRAKLYLSIISRWFKPKVVAIKPTINYNQSQLRAFASQNRTF